MSNPDECGAHDRLQQSPPQEGIPPSLVPPASVTAAPPQAWPATVHPGTPPPVDWSQSPTLAPCALLQIPPQHSLPAVQTSPFCVQNDPLEQTPPRQSLEQQSAWLAQVLPMV
jgi:hypothetical protein